MTLNEKLSCSDSYKFLSIFFLAEKYGSWTLGLMELDGEVERESSVDVADSKKAKLHAWMPDKNASLSLSEGQRSTRRNGLVISDTLLAKHLLVEMHFGFIWDRTECFSSSWLGPTRSRRVFL